MSKINIAIISAATFMICAVSTTAAGPANPQKDVQYSKEYEKCMANSNEIDPVMQDCTLVEADRQDVALNAIYKKLLAKLEPDQRASLKQTERAWIAFRDAECGYESGGATGGSEGRLRGDDCMVVLTRDRTAQLQKSLDWITF